MNIIQGDLTQQHYECLMNAANGIGPMGRGIAGALKRAGGEIVQRSAQEVCKAHSFTKDGDKKMGFDAGMTYSSNPGSLSNNGVKAIVHAVTMYSPMSPTSVEICKMALVNAVNSAIQQNFKSIGIPALGTGVGKLNKREVARMMIENLNNFDNEIEINIVDIDTEFINACRLAKQELGL